MEQKSCNSCKKNKMKFGWAFFIGIYFTMLTVWGQIAMIKYLIKLFNP